MDFFSFNFYFQSIFYLTFYPPGFIYMASSSPSPIADRTRFQMQNRLQKILAGQTIAQRQEATFEMEKPFHNPLQIVSELTTSENDMSFDRPSSLHFNFSKMQIRPSSLQFQVHSFKFSLERFPYRMGTCICPRSLLLLLELELWVAPYY